MCVVAEVGKGNNGGVYSDFGSEVRRSDDDVSELEVCHEFGYGDDKIFNKCVRDRLNVGFFVSVDWGVYRCVGDRVGSDDGITFGIYDGYNPVSSDDFFDGSNDVKIRDLFVRWINWIYLWNFT